MVKNTISLRLYSETEIFILVVRRIHWYFKLQFGEMLHGVASQTIRQYVFILKIWLFFSAKVSVSYDW